MDPLSCEAWGCSGGVFSPCGIAPGWISGDTGGSGVAKGQHSGSCGRRISTGVRSRRDGCSRLCIRNAGSLPRGEGAVPPAPTGRTNTGGGQGVAAELPCPGRRWPGAVSSAQRGRFVLKTGYHVDHGQTKAGPGVPEPLTVMHPRGEPRTGIPSPRGPAACCPRVLVSSSSPDGPASSHPRSRQAAPLGAGNTEICPRA